jgi:hypothetical protein
VTKKTRRREGASRSVLAAIESLRNFGGRAVERRSRVSIADLRERLLQMSVRELDAALLELERDGEIRLIALRDGEGTFRDRKGALLSAQRGLLGYAARSRTALRRPRPGAARDGHGKTVTLQVRVPGKLLQALDTYASNDQADATRLTLSRATVARQLLERILDRSMEDLTLRPLRSEILSAVASEARETGFATLFDVRRRLARIPARELDRALVALEARGALVLSPRPAEAPETEREVRGALWCATRGLLSRVRLPVPQVRLCTVGPRRRRSGTKLA